MADTTPTLREAAQQALEALAPLANATTPAEREALTDADAQAADAASCDLRAALAEQAAEQAEPVAQTSAEWERRFLAYDPKVDPAEAQCDIPPHGWRCTRAKGHDGPCAAVAAPDDVALVRRSMARLSAAEQAETVAAPAGYALVRTPITEEMHAAAAKALVRAHGLDGTPQRMLDAMIAAAPPAPAAAEQAKPVAVPAGWALVPVEPTAEMCAAPKAETWVGSNYCERIYRAMIAAAPPAPARQPAPALTVGMLMEAGLMVGSTPDSVGTSNWAARMLRALRMLAANQRTAAALAQPEGGA